MNMLEYFFIAKARKSENAKIIFLVAMVLGLCVISNASDVSTGTYKGSDGSAIVISAVEIAGIGSDKVVLSGKAHVKSFSKEAKSSMDAQADKIVVTLFSSPAAKNKSAQQSLFKSAELTGSPQMVYCTVDPNTGSQVKTTATSNCATYDGKDQMAYLKGNVKIINENPSLFNGPAIMTGDEAKINLKPNLGPDEERFNIKSSPGVSKIEVTPKSKEEAKPKN